MNRTYSVDLSKEGISTLIQGLKDYKLWIKSKSEELCERLAELGVTRAQMYFGSAIYDGDWDVEVHAEPIDNGYVVKASGEKILFVEFGSGLMGYGHPEPSGYGPGTYPGKGHWDDPNGWYYDHGKKSYGNPPNMPMYAAARDVGLELETIVKEVFSS